MKIKENKEGNFTPEICAANIPLGKVFYGNLNIRSVTQAVDSVVGLFWRTSNCVVNTETSVAYAPLASVFVKDITPAEIELKVQKQNPSDNKWMVPPKLKDSMIVSDCGCD